jgi:hypothetical protein
MDDSELIRALKQTVKQTHFVPNLTGRDDISPLLTPVRYGLPENADEAVNLFIEQIANLHESDYGDFMRSANLYLCELLLCLKIDGSASYKKIGEMKGYTQFVPSWDVDSTRARLLSDARQCLDLLKKTASEPQQKH